VSTSSADARLSTACHSSLTSMPPAPAATREAPPAAARWPQVPAAAHRLIAGMRERCVPAVLQGAARRAVHTVCVSAIMPGYQSCRVRCLIVDLEDVSMERIDEFGVVVSQQNRSCITNLPAAAARAAGAALAGAVGAAWGGRADQPPFLIAALYSP
jgi:hypothetical protein